jgi:hypothetical protein
MVTRSPLQSQLFLGKSFANETVSSCSSECKVVIAMYECSCIPSPRWAPADQAIFKVDFFKS